MNRTTSPIRKDWVVTLMVAGLSVTTSLAQMTIGTAPTSIVFRDSAYSSVMIVRDTGQGRETADQITTTVSYHTAHNWSGEYMERVHTYLVKEVNTERSGTAMEGEQGMIELTALTSMDGFAKPLWTKKIEANHVDYPEDYIQAVEYGCCAAESGYVLYRYSDGNELMSFSSELATVSIPNQRTKRYVGILSREAAIPQPDFDSDKVYLGLVTYVDPASMKRQQVILEDNRTDSAEDSQVWFDSISFTPSDARDRKGYRFKNELELWSSDARNDPNGFDGFTINITLYWDETPIVIRIPVVNDKLVISGIHSKDVRLRLR